MSEIRLIIREAEADWSGIVHGGSGDLAIAALSADPVTLKELEAGSGSPILRQSFERPPRQAP